MFKLIASDMDGTLLDENGQVPPETYELILALREHACILPHRQAVATTACASSLHLFATRWTLSPLTAPRSTPTARW